MGLMRSMLKDKSLPLELWDEAINTCLYMLNRSSMKSLQRKMTYEMWIRKKPKLSHLRIFGSIVHVKTLEALGKLEEKSKEIMFVGVQERYKGLINLYLDCISSPRVFEFASSRCEICLLECRNQEGYLC